LSPSGSNLVYSTYLGGGNRDGGSGIGIDPAGNAYVTGWTTSANFPTTPGAFQTTLGGVGDQGIGDAFIAKLNPSGSNLVYSTYLGGSSDDSGSRIAVDSAGNAYIDGSTGSTNFPVTANAFQPTFGGGDGSLGGGSNDLFVAELSASGSNLLYSTYFGGSGNESGSNLKGLVLDSAGNVYVTSGTSSSNDFPVTYGAFQTTFGGGAEDAFVAKIGIPSSIRISSIQLLSKTNAAISFPTGIGGLYDLQTRTDLVTGAWSSVVSNLVGTGKLLTITNSFAPNVQRQFYRVRLQVP